MKTIAVLTILAFAMLVIVPLGAALVVAATSLTQANRQVISDLAMKHRLPAMLSVSRVRRCRGLISYGANVPDMYRRAAYFVDKILKGAKPADLPIEQPTKFELVINMKTAKALGLTIPPSVLLRADQVVD
jgi:putative tryptophan/tyrosine transport system substrate-binding protein